MGTRNELAATEGKIFRAYWQDGVLDLLAGVSVLLIGVGWVAGFTLATVVVPPVALVTWPILRHRITDPRLGRVRFNARRRFEMRHGVIAVASLAVVLFMTDTPPAFPRWLVPGIPGLILAALALSAAAALRLVRFVAYAAVFMTAALIVCVLDGEPGWAIVAGGAAAAANGARMLASFFRDFPVLATEMDE